MNAVGHQLSDKALPELLTWREQEILELLAEELTSGEIEESEVLDLLGGLVDQSLAQAYPVESEQEQPAERYRMLETVRQYARDRLLEAGGGEMVRDRRLGCYLKLGDQAGEEITGAKQLAWVLIQKGSHRRGMDPAAKPFGAGDELYHIFLGWPVQRRIDEHVAALAAARQALGEATFARAWQKGKAMTLEEAFE